jgi:hypothetical protein
MSEANSPAKKIDRRSFLNQSAKIAAGTALGTAALSYGRILGANDRISLGIIGSGRRGQGLCHLASRLKDKANVELTAVCELWSVYREKATAQNARYYGRPPRSFKYMEDLLALKDVDAVIIATPEHSHSPVLKVVAEAGKDAYVEKPMGNVLEEVKAARDAVLSRNLIVQVGTQHRSEPYQLAVRDYVKTGALGDVSKVEIVWNYHGPRWRGDRPGIINQLREEDTDWRKWLMTKPYRPFDPQLYCEFRLYKDFSAGIADQWLSHGIDSVHYFLVSGGPRRRLRLARWAREPGHLPGAAGLPEGLSGELRHQLRKRFRELQPHHGQEADLGEHRRRGQPALEVGRGERRSRGRSQHLREARLEVHHPAG